jgi:hypothetical protein
LKNGINMSRYKQDEQMNRFWEAETNRAEEVDLLQNWLKLETEGAEKSYAHFISQSKLSPSDIEAEAWDYIQKHSARRKIPILARWSIAASLAILIASGGILYSISVREKRMKSFSQLESALSFTAREITPQPGKEILYEDDVFIIVAVN